LKTGNSAKQLVTFWGGFEATLFSQDVAENSAPERRFMTTVGQNQTCLAICEDRNVMFWRTGDNDVTDANMIACYVQQASSLDPPS
jgi:hypothetical protein